MSVLRPTHDQALVIPRPDIHMAVLGLWDPGIDGFLETEHFGKVQVACPMAYGVPAVRNSFALVEVDSWGEGTHRGAGMDKPEVEKGDIVGIDLCQVGHAVNHGGKRKWFVPWKEFLCKVTPVTFEMHPLMNYVMTVQDEQAENHLIFKGGGSSVIAPPSIRGKGVKANDSSTSKHRVACERVVEVGHGRFVKKVWVEPGCQVGDAVIFMPTNASVDAQLKGPRRRFTPWSEIEAVLSDYAA